jgi:hypothetical protein
MIWDIVKFAAFSFLTLSVFGVVIQLWMEQLFAHPYIAAVSGALVVVCTTIRYLEMKYNNGESFISEKEESK